MFSDKLNKSIAEAAKKCMDEELKGNQHKIDANKNGKIDAEDFKKLRKEETIEEKKYEPAEPDADAIAKKKAREEAQRRREERAERDADDLSKDYKPKTQSSGVKKVAGKAYGGAAQKSDVDESVQIDETPVTKAKAPYRPGSIDPATGKTREAPKGTMAYDAAQRKKLKESFSSLIESYVDGGIKSLFENLQVVEEQASEEEFNAELKKQKDKAEGKAPQAEIDKLRNELAQLKKQGVAESTSVTDYNPKSQGGTRKELLAKYHKTKDPKDAEAARKAGATQKELQGVAEGLPGSLSKSDYMPGAVRHDLSNIKSKKQEPQRR